MSWKKSENRSGVDSTEKIRELTEKLQQGVRGVFESGEYAEYLKTVSKFYNYSYNNTLLIFMQKPDATFVAGYVKWQKEFGRVVRRGEKSIKIFVPIQRKVTKTNTGTDESGIEQPEETVVTLPAFRVGNVFDVSQTVGEPLPTYEFTANLTGDVERFDIVTEVLQGVSPVPIDYEPITSGANGFFDRTAQRIVVKEGMSELQTVKTAVHEIAHATLHNFDIHSAKAIAAHIPDRNTREVEAESIAYVVCQYYGLDTSDYSFGYVTSWSKDKDIPELRASLKTIGDTASKLIADINRYREELTNGCIEEIAEVDETNLPVKKTVFKDDSAR